MLLSSRPNDWWNRNKILSVLTKKNNGNFHCTKNIESIKNMQKNNNKVEIPLLQKCPNVLIKIYIISQKNIQFKQCIHWTSHNKWTACYQYKRNSTAKSNDTNWLYVNEDIISFFGFWKRGVMTTVVASVVDGLLSHHGDRAAAAAAAGWACCLLAACSTCSNLQRASATADRCSAVFAFTSTWPQTSLTAPRTGSIDPTFPDNVSSK